MLCTIFTCFQICIKFCHLIIRQIITGTFVAMRCQSVKLKYTKCIFDWGFASYLVEGAYSDPPVLYKVQAGLPAGLKST